MQILISKQIISEFCFCLAGLVLNEFIQHFEPAHFSLEELSRQVRRTRRSVSPSADLRAHPGHRYQTPITFNLTAHNRLFQVSLVEDAGSVMAPDATFENTHGVIDYQAKILSGFLQGKTILVNFSSLKMTKTCSFPYSIIVKTSFESGLQICK